MPSPHRLAGHFWTIARHVESLWRPTLPPKSELLTIEAPDPRGAVVLSAALQDEPSSTTLVVVVHGLGGDAGSPYCVRAALAAADASWACLRVNLRGADGRGDDFYHAGLTGDLEAVLAHPRLRRFERVFVLGYSLGGHMVLRYGLQPEPRVRAVAAICAPLDLDRSSRAFDGPGAFVYRRVVLGSLKRTYAEVARKRERAPTPMRQVAKVRTIRQWDSLTVVPRYGFGTVDNYYASNSVGPRLRELDIPTLYIGARHDPMVPHWTVRDALECVSESVEVHMLDDGGHVGFPTSFSLAGASGALEHHVMRWFARQTSH